MSDHFPTPKGVHYLPAPILPSSPTTVSGDCSSPSTSSNLWNRASTATDNTEFEDLYDVSEEDDDDNIQRGFGLSSARKTARGRTISHLLSTQPAPLMIPIRPEGREETWSAVDELKKITSPMPITPSVQLSMPPDQMDFMGKQQSLELPTVSAPPSLDGSLSSEQLAAMSAPPTPVIGNDENDTEEIWAGIQLQPDALATLQALSAGEDDLREDQLQVIDVSMTASRPMLEMTQQPLSLVTNFATRPVHGEIHSSAPSRQSLAGLTSLDIPSPSGFFLELSPRTRNTWHPPGHSPLDMPPPTSTTAEQFYRCPWNLDATVPPARKCPDSATGFYQSGNMSSEPVEQVIEVKDDENDDLTDDMPTARPLVPLEGSNGSAAAANSPASPEAEEVPIEIVNDYEPSYFRKQQMEALSNLGRTELWLMAQRAYLKGIDGDEAILKTIQDSPEEEDDDYVSKHPIPESGTEHNPETKKKTVRFSNIIPTTVQAKQLPSKLSRRESAYYRAFQHYIVRTQLQDVFVQQLSRFEALQSQRTALRETHRNQLLGKYQLSVVPQSAKKRLSANVARGDLVLTDDLEKLREEKEFEAMSQMTIPTWHVAALKFLNGGKLISAPVTKRLARISQLPRGRDGMVLERSRVLDLGGQSTGDWAWHCALQYPNAKIYTVTTKTIRQLSNANIRGPPNHRQVAVERLTKLPFADDQFDLISARELHGILKFVGENGEDEWEGCLRECMRVLKPGGYLEFSILDSDIINAGPLGRAKSVEFGFTLKTLGYDPSPSKLWLGRLARAGFDNVRRAWLCLPIGAKAKRMTPPSQATQGDVVSFEDGKSCQTEAMVTGSSDTIANVCSIVGGWSWERWLLRCEMEKVAGEMRLADTVTTGAAMREAGKCLDGVHAVMEEGRTCKAGVRMLNGYARKPRGRSEVIQIALAQ
ncbi:uncharacterized protein UV8b_02518 [Ustilaginoidea virens]|nr:uncharacterized protein UV8b_02518 [Ustilaginoidea virens]QUC18277.1 hypothetical protein UV8b_02518 [Ustilaginoidea virens]